MACIDKTYVNNHEDWKLVVDYARNTSFTCPNGIVLNLIDYCYCDNYTENEVIDILNKRKSIPVLNTSTSVDYFLIKYCPLEIIQNRMKEVYDKTFYNSVKNGTSIYDVSVKSKEIGKHFNIIVKPKFCKLAKVFSSYCNRYIKQTYDVQTDISITGYNEEKDIWILTNELGSTDSNTATTKCRSFKAVCRKIMKWNLPVGTKVYFFGKYKGEYGCIRITK